MKNRHLTYERILLTLVILTAVWLADVTSAIAQVIIFNPSSSTVVEHGETLTIAYNIPSGTGTVTIELYEGYSYKRTLVSGYSNLHQYNWNVGNTIAGDYRIRVISSNDGDAMSNMFTVTYSLKVTGGSNATVTAGQPMTIRWSTTLNSGHLNLDYRNAAGGWTRYSSGVALSATPYKWTTPSGNDYVSNTQVRLQSTSHAEVVAYVNNISLTKTLSLTSPGSGINLAVGDNLAVRWTSNYTGAPGQKVKIELYKGGTLKQTMANSAPNNGSFDWTVPATIGPGNDYQVRLSDVSGSPSVISESFILKSTSANEPVRRISYQSYDQWGNVRQTLDARGVPTAYKWGHNGTMLLAVVGNATSGEVAYEGYEAENVGWRGGSQSNQGRSGAAAHTGRYSWAVGAALVDAEYMTLKRFPATDLDPGGLYVFEAWAMAPAGHEDVHIQIKVWDGAQWHYGEKAYYTQTGSWQRLRVEFDLGEANYPVEKVEAVTRHKGSSGAVCYWDDLRFYPADGLATTASYDPAAMQPSAIAGPDHRPAYYRYDGLGRLAQLADPGRRATRQHIYYYSDNGSGNFDAAAPNYTGGIDYIDESGYSNFATSGGWTLSGSSPDVTFGVPKAGQTTVRLGTSGSWNGIYRPTGSGEYLGRVDFYPDGTTGGAPHVLHFDGGGYRFAVHYVPTRDRFRIQHQHNGGSFQYTADLPLEAPPNAWYTIEILKQADGTCTAWVYPKDGSRSEVNSYSRSGYPGGWSPQIRSGSKDDYFYLANFYGGGFRQLTEYFDGLGRPIQTQIRDGAYDVVTATGYDAQGRAWKAWKPYRWDTGHSFDSNVGARAPDYYDGDPGPAYSGRLYAETLYEASPLGRPVKAIPEGGEAAGGAVHTAYEVRPWGGHNYMVTVTTDEAGKMTEAWRDGWGRTVRTIADPGGIAAETRFEYDALDNLTKVKLVRGAGDTLTTTYTYDARGQLTEKTSPDAGRVRYKYDGAGNLRFVQDAVRAAAGQVVFTSYDAHGRPVAEGVAAASWAGLDGAANYGFESEDARLRGRWAYDGKPSPTAFPWNTFATEIGNFTPSNPKGHLVAQIHRFTNTATVAGANHWQLTLQSYDTEGRLADKWIYTGDRSDWDTHLAYRYNRLGEVTRLRIEVGTEVLYQHYEYNQRGLLSKVYLTDDGTVDTEPAEITYTYTASGTVNEITYRGGTSLTHGYDIRGRLTDLNDIGSTSSVPFAAKYGYENNSTVDWAKFWNPNIDLSGSLTSAHRTYTYDYSYDNLNRLMGANYTLDGSDPGAFDLPAISYDATGNITALQRRDQAGTLVDNLTYSYANGNNQLSGVSDPAGQPTSWDAASGSFGYDANGNLISMTGNPAIDNIAYDHRNLSIHTYFTDGAEQIANYNAEGQRILKEVQTSGGSTWNFYVRDGLSTLAVIANGELQYMNILGNDVTGRVKANGGAISVGGSKRYYLKDLLGSVRAVVDETGDVKENHDYGPWGILLDERQYVEGDETTGKFTGKELDEQSGWFHYGARDYMSILGRWPAPDPLTDEFPSWSPYSYAYNNPLYYTDPTGMSPVCAEAKNCDETYKEGSVVENRLGQWKYKGNNEWETVSLAEGVDEITSGLGYTWHRFEKTAGYEYHDFGDRTLAERTMNVTNNAGLLELIGGPRTAVVKGMGFISKLKNSFLYGGKTFSQYKRAYWATKQKQILEPIINPNTGQVWKQYMELHHRFIPARAGWVPKWLKNNKFNLTPVSSLEHAKIDPYRARFAPRWIKELYNLNWK